MPHVQVDERAEDIVGSQAAGTATDAEAELERVGEVDAYLHAVVGMLRRESYRACLVLALEAPTGGIAKASGKMCPSLITFGTHPHWIAALVRHVSTT